MLVWNILRDQVRKVEGLELFADVSLSDRITKQSSAQMPGSLSCIDRAIFLGPASRANKGVRSGIAAAAAGHNVTFDRA